MMPDKTTVYFEQRTILGGHQYWSAVACDSRPEDRSYLNLLLQEYVTVAGDIGTAFQRVEEGLKKLRDEMEKAGYVLKFIVPKFQEGERVYIVPIQEHGTVLKRRYDDLGEPIIDVTRDSDGQPHVCRECELTTPQQG